MATGPSHAPASTCDCCRRAPLPPAASHHCLPLIAGLRPQSCSSDYELLFWKVPWLPEAPQDPASSVDARTVRPHTKLGDLSSIQYAPARPRF